jgi:hypothetical protein
MSLGAQGAARRGELCKAAGFQRHLLRCLGPGDATPRELADGWAAFERNTREAIALGDSAFSRVFAVTASERAEAAVLAREAQGALDAGDATGALWPLVHAAAADPWNDDAREGLGAALAAAPGGAERSGQEPLRGAGGHVVLAYAGELLEHPALLERYVARMTGAPGVTLAIDASEMDPAAAETALGTLVDSVLGAGALDLLAVLGPLDATGRARLAAGVHEVLSDRPRELAAPRL